MTLLDQKLPVLPMAPLAPNKPIVLIVMVSRLTLHPLIRPLTFERTGS